MTVVSPMQWLAEQRLHDRIVCLVLDVEAEPETRQALTATLAPEQWCTFYSNTAVAELAAFGPACFLLAGSSARLIQSVLNAPQSHWGWLASLPPGAMPAWVEHWRQRLLIGQRPQQALYRFHDNRVLARALARLPETAVPAYLGQALSVCYWRPQAGWTVVENSAPGAYRLPDEPVWLQVAAEHVPGPEVQLGNVEDYLLTHHYEDFLALADQMDPHAWVCRQLLRAQEWGWNTSEFIEFLFTHSLRAPGFELPGRWAPRPSENPHLHLQRLRREMP